MQIGERTIIVRLVEGPDDMLLRVVGLMWGERDELREKIVDLYEGRFDAPLDVVHSDNGWLEVRFLGQAKKDRATLPTLFLELKHDLEEYIREIIVP